MAVVESSTKSDFTTFAVQGGSVVARLVVLDSLRGLAALSVVACHYLILLSATPFGRSTSWWLGVPPLSLLRTAYGSVILFFVLSGYVLALNLMGERRPSWLGFAARRFCRIWLPFAATILISFAIGCISLAEDPLLPAIWQANIWQPGTVTVDALVEQIAMPSIPIGLDLPAWSLVHELRISLFFPLLFVLIRRAPAVVLAASLCLNIAVLQAPSWLGQLVPGTAAYIVYFAAGAWLAINRDRIAELAEAANGYAKALIVIVALLLLAVPGDDPRAPVIAGVGAVLMIGLIAASPATVRLLSARLCKFLGRISYSLYLTHVVVLMALGSLLGGWLPVSLILAIAAPVIGLVAWIGYRCVERPLIRLGRRLAARFAG